MLIHQLEAVLKSSKTVKVQFRTDYNFLEWGIVLSSEIQTETVNENVYHYIFVGNLNNKVYIKNIIKVKDAWFA